MIGAMIYLTPAADEHQAPGGSSSSSWWETHYEKNIWCLMNRFDLKDPAMVLHGLRGTEPAKMTAFQQGNDKKGRIVHHF